MLLVFFFYWISELLDLAKKKTLNQAYSVIQETLVSSMYLWRFL